MSAVLITQCLQNDFVKPLASGEPLPNQLHVGHEESKRLIGEDIDTGPIGRFMDWANAQPSNQLNTIHIRDWHNPDCPDQASHLAQFKPHCIQNTKGADFIFSASSSESTIINSTTLNDFEGTELKATLDEFDKANTDRLRIGIIGVWTEAKVLFLAYELATRYPKAEIAICSALTASSSRSQHFLALQQLERLVGATVVNSIGEFIRFLGGTGTTITNKSIDTSLTIKTSGEMNLDPEYEFLI
ncbi:cysteine hydrolase family protein, partial [Oleiphilus sp. HI0067]